MNYVFVLCAAYEKVVLLCVVGISAMGRTVAGYCWIIAALTASYQISYCFIVYLTGALIRFCFVFISCCLPLISCCLIVMAAIALCCVSATVDVGEVEAGVRFLLDMRGLDVLVLVVMAEVEELNIEAEIRSEINEVVSFWRNAEIDYGALDFRRLHIA